MIQTFKEALYNVVHRSKLPAKQIADLAGKNYTRLCNCANENQENEHLYGKDIAPLTNLAENYDLVEHICMSVGGIFIRLPKGEGQGDLSEHILEMVKHLGDLSRTLQDALADNRIYRTEGKDLEKIVNELVQHCISFAMEVGRRVER